MQDTTKQLLDSISHIRAYRMTDRVPAPANQQEELLLILRGFEKSVVGKYWVKYETTER